MTRPWYRSTWAIVVGVIVLIGLGLAIAIPMLVQIDRYRPMLVRLIETNTGRQVEIDALRLSMFPTVHIEAINFRMKNPQGFPPGDAISAKSMDLGVSVAALLGRRVEITHVTLNGIRAQFLRDAAAHTNFDLAVPRGAPSTSATTPASGGGGSFLTLDRVGDVAVEDVEIAAGSYDRQHGKVTSEVTLSGLNAKIRSIDLKDPDWPKKLEAVADLRGVRLTAAALAKPVQFQSGEISYKSGGVQGTFSAALDTLRVNATAAVSSINPLSTATFTVTIPELDINKLQGLVRAIPGAGPTGAPAKSAAPAAAAPAQPRLLAKGNIKIDKLIYTPYEATKVDAQLSASTNTVRLDSYSLSTFGGTVQGAAALDYVAAALPASVTAKVHGLNLGQVIPAVYPQAQKPTGVLDADVKLATALSRDPLAAFTGSGTFSGSLNNMRVSGTAAIASLNPLSATFSVAIPELDVNKLQSLGVGGGKAPPAAGTKAPAPAAPPAPAAVPAQPRLLAKGNVKIDKLIFAPYEATKVDAQLSVSTNTVRLDSYSLSTFGGTVQGAAAVDYAAAALPASVTAKVHGLNLGQAIPAVYPQAQKLTGALDADVKLATALGRDPLAALTGSGTFSASLNNMRASGTAAIASLNPLSATFSVAIPELDVNKLQSLGVGGGKAPPAAGAKAPAPAAPAAAPAQRRLLARGDVKIDKLLLAPLVPLVVSQVRSHVGVYTDTVQMNPIALSAYGGTIQGAATLDYSKSSLPVAGDAKGRGIQVEPLLKALAPQSKKITGTLEADLTFGDALGQDPMGSFKGDGTFAMRNGTIQGFELQKNLAQMAQVLQLTGLSGDTRYSYLGGDIHIAKQRASSNNLRLQAEGLEGTAKGSVGFDRTLDISGIGNLSFQKTGTSSSGSPPVSIGQLLGQLTPALAGVTGARVPFRVRGTFDKPQFAVAGTPELLRSSNPQQQAPQQPNQQPQQPQLPNLPLPFKLP